MKYLVHKTTSYIVEIEEFEYDANDRAQKAVKQWEEQQAKTLLGFPIYNPISCEIEYTDYKTVRRLPE